MSKLPLVTAKELEMKKCFLTWDLFSKERGEVMHFIDPDGRYTTIPHHGGRVIARPLLRQILNQINLTPQEYLDHLRK